MDGFLLSTSEACVWVQIGGRERVNGLQKDPETERQTVEWPQSRTRNDSPCSVPSYLTFSHRTDHANQH